jgi:hypothetical protein
MKHIKRICALGTLAGAILFGVAGCAHDHSKDIPADAVMMSEGTGAVASRSSNDGTVYVYDASDDRIIYQGAVEKNQLVSLDPDKNRLVIDGKTVTEKGINGGHRHKIFFDRSPRDYDEDDHHGRRAITRERRRD